MYFQATTTPQRLVLGPSSGELEIQSIAANTTDVVIARSQADCTPSSGLLLAPGGTWLKQIGAPESGPNGGYGVDYPWVRAVTGTADLRVY